MQKRNWALVGVIAIAGGALAYLTPETSAAPESPSKKAELGQPAPDFKLKDVYGKSYSLKDFKGRIVVLEWFNIECPVIVRVDKQRIPQNTLAKYAKEGVVWLAIDSTAGGMDPEKNRIYAAEHGLSFPILHDTDHKVARMYDAKTTPHMYVIDKKGKLVYNGAIDDDPQGRSEEATNYVAEAIEALLKGTDVDTPRTNPYGCSVKYPSS